ncbi:MAG TPA: FAD-linked oxidase C-terminal domain-containing protein [Pyrinomonadaceae bacterium]|nr:FAD-linked oxidase C-terminal domain-containing protein [Pyrinomonadaceae bacterium]
MARILNALIIVDSLAKQLRAIVGHANVRTDADELLVYECDGLPQHKHLPRAVVFPDSTEQVSAVLELLSREGVPFTPRGAGTGLSGGALAMDRGVVIELARMRRILQIDAPNRMALVQPGVVNLDVSRAVAHLGLHYVPDPSSQPACTIGGNIAENAGGIHCLKYGTTTDHVLALKVVLSDGTVIELGAGAREVNGYDLLGLFVGSEGTFGIATEATLRLTPIPQAVRTLLAEFAEVNDASHAVSAIIAAGVMPAALEMMDREIIRAVEASVFAAGLPPDAGAALLIELDGAEAGLDHEAERVTSICLSHGARDCRSARDEAERKKLWAARKGAFGAIGRIAPDSMIQDAVVPRSRLPEVLEAAYAIAARYQLRIANVFHAGDGNLHPLICFDSRIANEVQRVKDAGRELMQVCVKAGGSITGEHGVGLDKRELLPLIFSEKDMEIMLRVRAAFDPLGVMNPGKIIPELRGCGEGRAVVTTSPNGKDSHPRFVPTALSRATVAVRNNFDTDLALQTFSDIVGEANIEGDSALKIYPATIDEMSEVMKIAARERWSVTPAGSMSWLNPNKAKSDLIVSTRRLNRIIEHEPADLVAITEAGVTLNNFNKCLGRSGQWLPIDPPDDDKATLGGVVATASTGAHEFGYGPARRHVIGMRVVMADGAIVNTGGSVVKNVAGYDLCKLFTGSYGTLGIIAQINFKLRPRPLATATIFGPGELKDLVFKARELLRIQLQPVAMELLSSRAASIVLNQSTQEPMLMIRFADLPEAVDSQCKAAALLHPNANRVNDDDHLWTSLAALPTKFREKIIWRSRLLPEVMSAFITDSSPLFGAGSMWHSGLGDGRLRVIHDNDDDSLNNARDKINNLGGTIVVENMPGEMIDGSAGLDFLSKRIKAQLDPLSLLPHLTCTV